MIDFPSPVLINALARDIARWIDQHGGRQPARVLVPQAIEDALIEEGKMYGLHSKEVLGGTLMIMGISVVVDPRANLGEIVP